MGFLGWVKRQLKWEDITVRRHSETLNYRKKPSTMLWINWTRFKLEKPSGISWQKQLADELHKPIKRNFTRRRVITNGIDKIWCSDLVGMQQLSKWNKGYRYLLMVLDLFSKYGWIVPLQRIKKGKLLQKHSKPSSKRVVNHNISMDW